jgi:SAM-dependent methyltransferase
VARAAMWEVVCRVVLQRYIRSTDAVVDLGAGFCEFINTIQCGEKIAIDSNSKLRERVAPGVRAVVGDIPDSLRGLGTAGVDVVFCSNVLEHLRDKDTVLTVLREIHRLLKPTGRLIIIQPNIRYAYKEYWDFFDHHVALSHGSLTEALHLTGFTVEKMRPRFLPYTTKSRLPKSPWLVRLYLALPPAQWLLGKQMLVVARKT